LFAGAFLSLYVGAKSGQRLGRSQLETLHQFIESCLNVENKN